MHEIIFYNGFNLLVDIIIVFITYRIAKSSGYRQGYYQAEADLIPFWSTPKGCARPAPIQLREQK